MLVEMKRKSVQINQTNKWYNQKNEQGLPRRGEGASHVKGSHTGVRVCVYESFCVFCVPVCTHVCACTCVSAMHMCVCVDACTHV